MLKKILITFLIVPIVGSAIYGYFYFKQVKTPLTSVLKAIPQSAVCITEAHDFTTTWKSFSAENAIWKELLSVDAFAELNTKINFFDSVFVHGQQVLKIDDNSKIYLSVHADTAQGVDFILAFNIPLTAEKRAVNDIIEQAIPVMYTKSDTLVAGIAVHQYSLRNGKKFYYYLNNTVFVLSYSPDLIEQSARTLVSDYSLLQNKSFTKVLKTAGSESSANVFVNFKNLSGIMPQYLSEDNQSFINALSGFAQWISMDLNLKNDIITMNGFSYSNDSVHDYLSLFKKQKAPLINLTSVLPTNTAFFSYFGVEDGARYLKDLNKFNAYEKVASNEEPEIKRIEKKYGIDLNYFFSSWVGNEMAAVVTESYGTRYNPDYYAVIKMNNKDKALKAFAELDQSLKINNNTSDSSSQELEIEYRNYTIKNLNLPHILPLVFGNAFKSFSTHYYTTIDNYLVMAENAEALRSMINFYLADRTLIKDKSYLKFSESLSENSNFFIYSAVARSSNLIAKQLDSKTGKAVTSHSTLFRKFQSLALQFKSSGDLFYNNLCLKYNPIYKPEFNTLWEIENDTTFITAPFLVVNTLDSSSMIAIQDQNLVVHLYDNKGKEVWKKAISDKIIGNIYQIMASTDGNFRLAFVTRKHLYMINEKGEFPEKYPVTLKSDATTGLGYINFNNKEHPMLLVACENLSIYNYKLTGKVDFDWKTERLKDTLKGDFVAFTCDGRDMICFADAGMNFRLIDKKGNWIVKFKEKLPGFHNSVLFPDIKKTVNGSGVIVSDENGVVYRYNFKGAFDKFELVPKVSSKYHFYYTDIDGDEKPEYVFADNNRLNVLHKDRSVLFDFTFNSMVNAAPQLLMLNDSVHKMVISTTDEGLFVFNANGTLNRGVTLSGNAPMAVTSIDRNKYFFGIATQGRKILAHALENNKTEVLKPLQ